MCSDKSFENQESVSPPSNQRLTLFTRRHRTHAFPSEEAEPIASCRQVNAETIHRAHEEASQLETVPVKISVYTQGPKLKGEQETPNTLVSVISKIAYNNLT